MFPQEVGFLEIRGEVRGRIITKFGAKIYRWFPQGYPLMDGRARTQVQ